MLWDSLTYLEQQQKYSLPTALMTLFDQLGHGYTPYNGRMNYDEIREQISKLIENIITLMSNISFARYCHHSIPMKRFDQKVKEIVTAFQNNVEFYSDNGKLALEEVPEIVFSEVMRDVDYFIQGCSIGLDLSLDLHGFPEDMLQYYQVGHPYSNS